MPEDLILTTPEITPQVITTTYRVVALSLDWERATIVIRVRGSNGEAKTFVYGWTDPSTTQAAIDRATALIVALNKANSVKSLQRRVLEQLTTDGLLVGTVTGAPD